MALAQQQQQQQQEIDVMITTALGVHGVATVKQVASDIEGAFDSIWIKGLYF